ncbi:DNA-binding transcription factor [Lithospermum erythrorhizon]|uniref:DNA-binding transcription factor n=1 Tax=Lithospermum erythrorhizon TaxID=34254 RepID=A0AAV3PJ61_LITER
MAKLSQKKNIRNNSGNDNNNNNNNASKIPVNKPKRTRKTVPRDTPLQRSSIYRGVTRHRWTGRYEAHLWDKNCWNESQSKKGRQGAYDEENAAAHAYDLAALKYWGPETILNFPLSTYEKELKQMEGQSREEYIGSLRRKSNGFSRGVSKYRGVARHHHNGRWEARIGRVFGNKYLYLGTYATQEEAAVAYDMAAIEYRGLNAVTNFDLSRYIKWLKPSSNNTNDDTTQINEATPNIIDKTSLTPPTLLSNCLESTSTYTNHLNSSSSTTSSNEQLFQTRPTTATSALGLLLQSSKFKELMEMNMAAEYSSTPETDDCPQFIFPEDSQTQFDDYGGYCDQGDDTIFGELNSFMSPPVLMPFNSILNDEVHLFIS